MHTYDVYVLGWNGILKLEVLGALHKITSVECLWYMDECIIGSAVELVFLKSAWELGPLLKMKKVPAPSGLIVVLSLPERCLLGACTIGGPFLTLTLKRGVRERKEYFIKTNLISPVSEVLEGENRHDKKREWERLLVTGKRQKSLLYIAVATQMSKWRTREYFCCSLFPLLF